MNLINFVDGCQKYFLCFGNEYICEVFFGKL